MALIIQTQNPTGLLRNVKQAINERHVDTWLYDEEGDFTHTPEQWKYNAWMRPIVASNTLVFGIVGNNSVQMTKEIYAVFHGRFAEMLLAHFDLEFASVSATALGDAEIDLFKTGS